MRTLKTRTRYAFVGSDYSQQEPRLLAAVTQDPALLDAYENDKDMYAVLGTRVFHNNYEDNLEHFPDGTKNEEGTKRRKKMKVLYLGITYGMGPQKLSESLGCSKEEAEGFINGFFEGFPKVKQWMDNLKDYARKNGFIEDPWGRKRRLPDIQLDEYSFSSEKDGKFNPLLGTVPVKEEVSREDVRKWTDRMHSARGSKERAAVVSDAKKTGIIIKQNGGFIGDAERQCVNSAIQGGAASMTKSAMNMIYRDEELNSLDFHLVNAVHDELIGECPVENAERCAELLTGLMKSAAKDIPVKFKCDAEIEHSWGENAYAAGLQKEYKTMLKEEGCTEEVAFQKLKLAHKESLEDDIKRFLDKEV